ncbi:hypothetical protein ACFX2I_006396 [Malus domestica]
MFSLRILKSTHDCLSNWAKQNLKHKIFFPIYSSIQEWLNRKIVSRKTKAGAPPHNSSPYIGRLEPHRVAQPMGLDKQPPAALCHTAMNGDFRVVTTARKERSKLAPMQQHNPKLL